MLKKAEFSTGIYGFMCLIPLFALLGLKFIAFHIFAFTLAIKGLAVSACNYKKILVPKPLFVLFLFCLLYLASIAVNYPQNDLTRTVASLYNLSYWLIGLILILTFYNYEVLTGVEQFFKGVKYLGVICVLFGIGVLVLWYLGQRDITLPGVFFHFNADSSQLLYDSSHLFVISSDWFLGRFFPRTSAVFLYPNALGVAMTVIVPLTLAYQAYMGKSKKPIFLYVLPLALSLSRTALIALFIAFLHDLIICQRKHVLVKWFLILVVVIVLLVNLSYLGNLLLESREGSSLTRLAIYRVTLEHFWDQPVIGIGAKPRLDTFAIPLGSHSTVIGLLLKTGALGLSLFLIFIASVYMEWLKLRHTLSAKIQPLWRGLGFAFVGMTLCLLTEDLDAPQIVSFLYFAVVGIILSLGNLDKIICQAPHPMERVDIGKDHGVSKG